MIVRDLGVLFVHIPKTAGQSVSQMLLFALGLRWRDRAPFLIAPNEDPRRGPEYLTHLYAREYTELGHVSAEDFDSLFKFTVVRDPYDRLVSEFNYRTHDARSVRDMVHASGTCERSDRRRHVAPQIDYVTAADGERVLVDDIVFYERLEADMARIGERVFGQARTLPLKNYTKTLRLTVDELDRADLDFITETYARDFRVFGYPTR